MEPDQLASLENSVIQISWLLKKPADQDDTVFSARSEIVIINQNMKYRIVLTLYILLVQGHVNRNFQLVLNEMGPGRTSRAWYFHSHAYILPTPTEGIFFLWSRKGLVDQPFVSRTVQK